MKRQEIQFWRGRPVFVTGATGLMGSWLVDALLAQEANVVALVRDSVPHGIAREKGLLDRVTVCHGSIEDFHLLRRCLAEYQIDTVFHLAAQPLVGVAKLDPLTTLEINIRGSWNVLEAARLCGTPRVVMASSDKAYGVSDSLPYRETHPMDGRFPYDVSKSCADLIARMYAATYQLPVGIVRCANLFGGGDLNFSRTIPGVIKATLEDERFVIRSDGKFVRDFLYVKDAAEAYLSVAEALAGDPGLAGEAFNFSLGIRATVLEIVQLVLGMMDRKDLAPVIQNRVSSEIREQFLSTEKAQTVLGWKPRFSLESGLLETIDWYRGRLSAGVPVPQTGSPGALAASSTFGGMR